MLIAHFICTVWAILALFNEEEIQYFRFFSFRFYFFLVSVCVYKCALLMCYVSMLATIISLTFFLLAHDDTAQKQRPLTACESIYIQTEGANSYVENHDNSNRSYLIKATIWIIVENAVSAQPCIWCKIFEIGTNFFGTYAVMLLLLCFFWFVCQFEYKMRFTNFAI